MDHESIIVGVWQDMRSGRGRPGWPRYPGSASYDLIDDIRAMMHRPCRVVSPTPVESQLVTVEDVIQ